jgi:hypothetical protein
MRKQKKIRQVEKKSAAKVNNKAPKNGAMTETKAAKVALMIQKNKGAKPAKPTERAAPNTTAAAPKSKAMAKSSFANRMAAKRLRKTNSRIAGTNNLFIQKAVY